MRLRAAEAFEIMPTNLDCLASRWISHRQVSNLEDDHDSDFYIIGDRVIVDGYRLASVAYFGEVEFASGDWVGLVLDEPTGNHSGRLHGREYFQCAPKHGLLVRASRVSRLSSDSAIGSSSSNSSSRNSTPLSHTINQRPSSRLSASSNLTDSYFYDDDYRLPTLASLAHRLRNIETPSAWSQTTMDKQYKPISILKKNTLEFRPKLNSQISVSPDKLPEQSVFNFRPQRAQLSDYELKEDPPLVNFSRDPFELGDKVLVYTNRGELPATLRFYGETQFATGEWAGVELDYPEGKNDGSVLGHRYFYCPQDCGLFVPASRMKHLSPSRGKTPRPISSTIWSPPPLGRSQSVSSSVSPSEGRDLFKDAQEYQQKVSNFDDSDIETQIKRSMSRTRQGVDCLAEHPTRLGSPVLDEPRKPIAIKYTFTSSKLDGNPIARRTVEYA